MSADIKLPGVLGEIEAAAGRDAALTVALKLGGQVMHVPAPDYLLAHPDHPLARTLGAETASKAAARLAGGQVYVPRARRALVPHLAEAGHGSKEIARRLGCSARAVRNYLRHA